MGCLCRRLLDDRAHAAPSLSVGVWIANVGEISCARTGPEVAKKLVVARSGLKGTHPRTGLIDIAEADGAGGTSRLAGGNDLAIRNLAVFLFGAPPRPADALDAISALLHHAALPRRYVRIVLGANRLGPEIGVFLPVSVTKEIEPPHLVRAVRFAKPRAHAAVIYLEIEAFSVMHRSRDRTDRLARRVLAMHARDRLKTGLRRG